MHLNHPETIPLLPQSVETLPSTKPVLGAKCLETTALIDQKSSKQQC